MITLRRTLAAATVALLLGCKGDGTGPTAGTLKVNLTTPNSGLDGAAVVVLSAPVAPGSVTPGAGLLLWGGPVTTANATIALTGTLSAGTILTLQVDDVNQFAQYTATLQQVAATAAGGFVVRPLAGYSLAVEK
ncbi:MAG: hypothetical protein ACREMF_06305 [Gemmatimonadales bacterium]